MSTMNISLPEALKAFFDAQVAERGYGTSSECVRELIREAPECQHLRGILLAGAESRVGHLPIPPTSGLRTQVREATSRRP